MDRGAPRVHLILKVVADPAVLGPALMPGRCSPCLRRL
jgi:hypothetical protein